MMGGCRALVVCSISMIAALVDRSVIHKLAALDDKAGDNAYGNDRSRTRYGQDVDRIAFGDTASIRESVLRRGVSICLRYARTNAQTS